MPLLGAVCYTITVMVTHVLKQVVHWGFCKHTMCVLCAVCVTCRCNPLAEPQLLLLVPWQQQRARHPC